MILHESRTSFLISTLCEMQMRAYPCHHQVIVISLVKWQAVIPQYVCFAGCWFFGWMFISQQPFSLRFVYRDFNYIYSPY